MQYLLTVEVGNQAEAALLGMTLQQWGYKVLSGQVSANVAESSPRRIRVEVSAEAVPEPTPDGVPART